MHEKTSSRGELLALGFGTTTAMWTVGYICHIPPAIVPSPLVLLLLLLCLIVSGYVAGRTTGRGWIAGLQTGLIAGALNLLILGSLITGDQPNRIVPSALLWLPGSLIVCSALGALGAAFYGKRMSSAAIPWTSAFAWVTATATFFLLAIGGIVTAQEAGLAVVDWPNSFGYNMFLYPLSRMTGGIYFEHAHRLFGSLVGLTTLTLAIHLFRTDDRTWIRGLGFAALVMVIVQGILGGLRVTGRLTLSASPEDTAPNLILAMIHGVFGQVFFATLVSIAVFTLPSWRNPRNVIRTSSARTERIMAIFLVALTVVQIATGAILRHTAQEVMVHIGGAVFVAVLAAACGIRAWGLYAGQSLLQKIGLSLIGIVSFQLLLGLLALWATNVERTVQAVPTALDVVFTTLHQATGAVVLAVSVVLLLWVFRLLKSP